MKRHGKNNKGFSLVELIIVIGLIVTLVAVVAPQYVKYIKKTHDAVLAAAAEDVLSAVKTEYGVGNMTGIGDVVVKRGDDGTLSVTLGEGLEYHSQTGESFYDVCGVDLSKTIESKLIYTIKVRSQYGAVFIYKPEEAEITMEIDS